MSAVPLCTRFSRRALGDSPRAAAWGPSLKWRLQGYLAHKKPHPRRTLQ